MAGQDSASFHILIWIINHNAFSCKQKEINTLVWKKILISMRAKNSTISEFRTCVCVFWFCECCCAKLIGAPSSSSHFHGGRRQCDVMERQISFSLSSHQHQHSARRRRRRISLLLHITILTPSERARARAFTRRYLCTGVLLFSSGVLCRSAREMAFWTMEARTCTNKPTE